MFTGIIYSSGLILQNKTLPDNSRLIEVKCLPQKDSKTDSGFTSCNIGDSVAINGICLTIVKINLAKKSLEFFVSHETSSKTTIILLNEGTIVNLEFALLASSKLGGHIVTGHIDETIKFKSKSSLGDSFVLNFECSSKNSKYLIKKGSICIDGVALTINNVIRNSFEVCIIPHTWQNTTLQNLDQNTNNICNVEYDYFAKIIISKLEVIRQ